MPSKIYVACINMPGSGTTPFERLNDCPEQIFAFLYSGDIRTQPVILITLCISPIKIMYGLPNIILS